MRPCGQLACVREMSVIAVREDHRPHVGPNCRLVKQHQINRFIDYSETFGTGTPIEGE